MNKKQFIESQKDCAAMLGLSLEEYQKNVEIVKAPKVKKTTRNFDNSILEKLGLTEKNLKRKKMI